VYVCQRVKHKFGIFFGKHVLKFVFKAKKNHKIDSELFNQGQNRNIGGKKESGSGKRKIQLVLSQDSC
jgi:hypothetical protein